MTTGKYCAFIFARGGSKGVTNKNIRNLAGKPLIAYSIECAATSRHVDKIVVSTESPEIAHIAKQYGADVLERPSNLASDTSPELLSWKHAIDCYPGFFTDGAPFISLPATSPLRSPVDVDAAIEKFLSVSCDILLGITPSHRNPYLNMVTIKESQFVDIVNNGSDATRRQDAPCVFDITTCVYVGDAHYISNCDQLMQGNVGYIEIPTERALDIDTEYDLYLADLMINSPYNKADFSVDS